MILKSMGRKSSSFGQVIEYITKEKEKISVPPHLIFTHNLFGKTLREIENEFLKNESSRQYRREGVNRLYHEWISFHDQDRDRLTDSILEDLARQYFRIRNENALYLAAVHRDKDHVHVHFLVSGTEISGKSLRISKLEFNEIKKSLQDYQIQNYPQLQNSISNFEASSKNPIQSKEYKVIERKGKSDKQILKEQLEVIFKSSMSKEDFILKIQESGLSIYTRGVNTGIVMENGRNLRFKNLGFDDERFKELERVAENQKSIESIRATHKSDRKLTQEKLLKEVKEKEQKEIGVKGKTIDSSVELDENDIELEGSTQMRINLEYEL